MKIKIKTTPKTRNLKIKYAAFVIKKNIIVCLFLVAMFVVASTVPKKSLN